MRVLVANKFGFLRGGLERVMFDEMASLEAAGHEVALFTTRHQSNEPSAWSDYFAPYLEIGEGGGLSAADRLTAAGRMFRNAPAARQFARLLRDFKPDVVHIHGIHRQISPSILASAARQGVPVVQSLHDYHHVCPADSLLYRGTDVCDPRRCGTLWYGPAVAGRCVRGSLAASALSAAETTWARASRVYERRVARFICPSRFIAEVMSQGQWTVPVDVVPNATQTFARREGVGDGFVVVGRIAREKGIAVALEAAERAGVRMTVVGDGPLREPLQSAFPDVRFAGHLSADEVTSEVQRARAVVVPSVCYENASMTVLEAMAAGVPVVASAIGGIPEQVTDGQDGRLVPRGDINALCAALTELESDPELARRMGVAGRETIASRFSPSGHLAGILGSYERAMERS